MQAPDDIKTRKLVNKLLIIVVSMFGFGFLMVPLYDVFCDITGLNGKTATEAAQVNESGIDATREIKVQFISKAAKDMPWQFRPEITEMSVQPGETKVVKFYAKNETAKKNGGSLFLLLHQEERPVISKKSSVSVLNNRL